MRIDKEVALVDNDFVEHVSEINRPQEEVAGLTKRVISGLGVSAVMHPLLYKNELNKTARNLFFFSEGVFYQSSFSELFQNEKSKEAYYCYLVPELYKKLNGKKYDARGQSVLEYWARNENMGEIHSMAACFVCEYGLFLSDDSDAKALRDMILREYSEVIKVYSRNDVINNISFDITTRQERRMFAHN